jgi:hypothetical protein
VVIQALSKFQGADMPAGPLAAATAQFAAGVGSSHYPYSWIGRAAGLEGELPRDEAELLVRVLAATISPEEETGLDAHEEASVIALELGDWAGAVIELVRAGPGTDASPSALVRAIDACPEVQGPATDTDDATVAATAFELVGFAWEAIGILDDQRGLTPLGAWALPRALTRAWGGGFRLGNAAVCVVACRPSVSCPARCPEFDGYDPPQTQPKLSNTSAKSRKPASGPGRVAAMRPGRSTMHAGLHTRTLAGITVVVSASLSFFSATRNVLPSPAGESGSRTQTQRPRSHR